MRKLIEVKLPLDEINRGSARGESMRRGHPCTRYLWRAHRPLAAARTIPCYPRFIHKNQDTDSRAIRFAREVAADRGSASGKRRNPLVCEVSVEHNDGFSELAGRTVREDSLVPDCDTSESGDLER